MRLLNPACGWWALLMLLVLSLGGCETAPRVDAQPAQPAAGSRHWLGPAHWGNRLQDWRFEDGRIVCVTPQGWLPMRTVHDLTKQVRDNGAAFEASVVVSLPPAGEGKTYSADSGAGMLVGVGNGEMDYRAASIVHEWHGLGAGLFAGVDGLGQAFIVDNEKPWTIGGLFDASQALPRDKWRVSADSSEKGSGPDNAIDGKPGTHWHTEYIDNKLAHPHELVIDLGGIQRFAAFAYLPRQDNDSGRVGDYAFYASNERGVWADEPIAAGTLPPVTRFMGLSSALPTQTPAVASAVKPMHEASR